MCMCVYIYIYMLQGSWAGRKDSGQNIYLVVYGQS